jgi:hypothetical protein
MSMRVDPLFLVAFALGTTSAQTVEETCSIEGRITSAGMNLTLRKASVSLYLSGGSLAIAETGTDPDGNFCFVNVKSGEYRVAAEQAGYMRREYGAGRWQERGTVFLLSADQRRTANIELFPRGGIRGRVVDYDGDTVPTSRVTALRLYGGMAGANLPRSRILIAMKAANISLPIFRPVNIWCVRSRESNLRHQRFRAVP